MGMDARATRIVRRADQRQQPWRNGRGVTTEIAIEPAGASLAGDFDWRISMAPITEDGAFSTFPGVDRTLVLLEGRGLDLEADTATLRLSARYAMARFPGEWAVHARLHAGAVRDLNVMVRRPARHRVAVRAFAGRLDLPPAAPLVVVLLEGGLEVDGERLAAGDTLVTHAALAGSGSGVALVVEITRDRASPRRSDASNP